VAGKTAVSSCTAGLLSDPKEGEVRLQGVQLGVAENSSFIFFLDFIHILPIRIYIFGNLTMNSE
jgi:hypothetical protein